MEESVIDASIYPEPNEVTSEYESFTKPSRHVLRHISKNGIRQHLKESLDEVSGCCKNVIQKKLERYNSRETEKFEINIDKIKRTLDMEFEQFYNNLKTDIERLYGRRIDWEDFKVCPFCHIKDTHCKCTSLPERNKTRSRPNVDITVIIINRLKEEFYVATVRFREKIKYSFEGKEVEMPKEEDEIVHTQPLKTSMEYESLILGSEMQDKWLEINQHIGQIVERLQKRMVWFTATLRRSS
ncbi:hypothetical protein LOTGIDRAFT_198122, partial [Lottia gigantea]